MDRPDLERTPAYPTTQSPKAHLVPDDEVGMVGLAGWLKAEGFDVSSAPSNARFDQAHRPASVPKSARWLVYAPDVPVEHRDRLVARREGIAESSYPAVLRDVLGRKLGIAIAGRRQGRLAAAMIGWTLTHAGFDPTVLLRGNVAQLGGAARSGRGAHAVADVTEALDEAILGEPSPQMAVMLDIEKIGSRRTQILERLATFSRRAGQTRSTSHSSPRKPASNRSPSTREVPGGGPTCARSTVVFGSVPFIAGGSRRRFVSKCRVPQTF
jgi:hypothetical protein